MLNSTEEYFHQRLFLKKFIWW